jgi:phosphatidylinositol alpha-1,6-mannosyltransferase
MADAVATYTEEGANWVSRYLPGKQIVALGNAIDTRAIRRARAKATPIRRGSPNLLAIGRFTADKRFDQLLEIHRLVRRSLPEATLTLIGDGPERERLRQSAAEDLDRSVFMPGALHAERDLAPYFLGADALVIAGAAGLAVNHAIAYDLPAIVFARQPGGPRHHPEIEYVRDGLTGWSVSPATPSAMAERLISSYRDGALADLKAGMKLNQLAPSISSVADRIAAILDMSERPE